MLPLVLLPSSESAGIWFVALFGVAALNGVVLASYILEFCERP